MHAVLALALPVFAVIGAGLLAGRLGLAGAEDSAALNRFVFRFAMPAALFALFSGGDGLGPGDLRLALAYGAAAAVVLFSAYLLARTVLKLDPPTAGACAVASTIGNAVFLGLPIATGIEGWARPFAVLMLVEWIAVMGIGTALMFPPAAGTRRPLAAALLRPVANPIVAASLAGFALAAFGVALPGPGRAVLDLLGRAAAPAALFALGLFLATRGRKAPAAAPWPSILLIALMKMAALPALALFLYGRFDAPSGPAAPAATGALALFTATPTAVAAFVMAAASGRHEEESAAAILATTALSVATITLVLLRFA